MLISTLSLGNVHIILQVPHISVRILQSLQDPNGVVRVVFGTVALGMGVNLKDIIHYGAPSSIEAYFQESGRGGRSGDSATSTVWLCEDTWKTAPCSAS